MLSYSRQVAHVVLYITAAHNLLGYEGQKVTKCSALHPAVMTSMQQSVACSSYYRFVLQGALVECVHRSAAI